jgi:1-acyl-sn-glycerol-3-phosphate acyltransferase
MDDDHRLGTLLVWQRQSAAEATDPMGGILSGAANVLVGAGSTLLPSGLRSLGRELRGRLRKAPPGLNEYGYDPYGFHPDEAWPYLIGTALLYRHYFRVETRGIERVPSGGVLLVANHAGQFAYDGAMLTIAMLLEAEPPRLARGMGEYFLWKVPWMGITASRIGTLVGTPENCIAMLEAGECVMVFPEGARGANKPFRKRYQLQRFGLGFMRLALQAGVPIVPVGIVGSEEQQPGFANLEGVAERLGLPSLPITVTQPWLGPIGSAMALPVKYHIYFGDPLYFEGEAHEDDRGRRERTGIFR